MFTFDKVIANAPMNNNKRSRLQFLGEKDGTMPMKHTTCNVLVRRVENIRLPDPMDLGVLI